ncbi:MAG: MraY family glycosyltransferase [Saprospiraceae bacterium]|jgi:UDP-N-acetylmuramyl pentapeptide phosphotransferase/UDP-N-acetylglucosamine-1-phosphate transferase|nr:MraY family glycosyltransferase [Saprospiraceae bacterium]
MATLLLIGGFILSFGVTFFLIPPIIKIATKRQLFDVPNHRKMHENPTPALGGISLFISFWIVVIGLGELSFLAEVRFLLISGIILLLVGIQDDLIGMRASTKFIWQLVVGSLLYSGGFRIEGLYGFMGFDQIPIIASFILTILVISLIINAFNLIDGINGLAGSLGLIGSVGFGVLFYLNGLYYWAFMTVVLIGVLLGFLKYNFGKATIFMGDNGSMFLGLILSAFFIKCINIVPSNNLISIQLISICFIIIPVFDLLRVFTKRLINKQSPFLADRSHLHHILLGMGKSHTWIVRVIVTINIAIILLAQLYLSDQTLANSFFIITAILLVFVGLISFSQNLTAIKSMESERHFIGFLE